VGGDVSSSPAGGRVRKEPAKRRYRRHAEECLSCRVATAKTRLDLLQSSNSSMRNNRIPMQTSGWMAI
jgi:hypothetical protein